MCNQYRTLGINSATQKTSVNDELQGDVCLQKLCDWSLWLSLQWLNGPAYFLIFYKLQGDHNALKTYKFKAKTENKVQEEDVFKDEYILTITIWIFATLHYQQLFFQPALCWLLSVNSISQFVSHTIKWGNIIYWVGLPHKLYRLSTSDIKYTYTRINYVTPYYIKQIWREDPIEKHEQTYKAMNQQHQRNLQDHKMTLKDTAKKKKKNREGSCISFNTQ